MTNNTPPKSESNCNNQLHKSILSQINQFLSLTQSIIEWGQLDENTISNIKLYCENIEKIISSSEYISYENEINSIIGDIRWQDFIFDIEWVLIHNIPIWDFYYKHLIPWIIPILTILIKNWNRISFWTSALNSELENMKKSLPKNLSKLTIVCRNDFEKILLAIKNNLHNPKNILDIVQTVFPESNICNYTEIIKIIESNNLNLDYLISNSHEYKFPQLFINSNNWFFIDDYDGFIDSATNYWWPRKRAIKLTGFIPNKDDYIKLANNIRSGL